MHTVTSIISGIALLLSGIYFMRCGLQNILGSKLRQILVNLTMTPWRGLIVGTAASALMQSSTAVSLITIGLVSADYLSFYQSLGIILGANIGTCTTVQMMALPLPDQYFTPLLLSSILIAIFVKKLRYIAMSLSGFFGIFIGIDLISNTLSQISELNLALQYIAAGNSNPLYGIAGGILITVILQSSSAATALLMVLATGGVIDLTTALYVVYGNNIGSCISSLIIGAATPLAAKRVAASHIILNIAGVLLFLPITSTVAFIIEKLVSDFPGQIALAHTGFNLLSSLIVLPFTKQYAKFIVFLVPEKN
jgi:phosphate:Na+ symporter